MSRLYIILLIWTFCSCTKEPLREEPYLEYDNVGKLLLSGVNVNDTFKFAGSNGSYREYKVFNIEKKKETVQDCTWNTGYPKLIDWFVKEYPKHTDAKLDMGKSCIRFKKPEKIPFKLFGELMVK